MSCKECACFSCSQRENCNMNGCYGGGCSCDDLIEFKSDWDDYEVDIYSEPEEDWDDDDD